MQVGDGSKAIPVGTSVAILGEEGDSADAAAIAKLLAEDGTTAPEPKKEEAAPTEEKKVEAVATTPAPTAPKAASSQPSGDRSIIFASPVAKRLALEQGIPLGQIKGSGPGGRIIKADIDSYKPAAASAAPAPAAKASSAPAPASSSSSSTAPASAGVAYTDTPVSNMRRVIASRLTESKSGTPHYYLTVEVNMDRVAKLREVFNSAAKAAEAAGGVKDGVKGGVKLSVNDFIVKASALALQDVPEANSGWHGDFIRQCVLLPSQSYKNAVVTDLSGIATTRRTSRSPSRPRTASSLPSSPTPAPRASRPSPRRPRRSQPRPGTASSSPRSTRVVPSPSPTSA